MNMFLSNKSDVSWAHCWKDFNYQLPILITDYQFNYQFRSPVQKLPFSYTESSLSLLSLTFSLRVLRCSPLKLNASVILIVRCQLHIHSSLTVNTTSHTPKWGGITYSQCVSQKKKNGEIFGGVYLVRCLEREFISNLQLHIQQFLDCINASHSYCQNKPLLGKRTSCGISWIAFSFLFSILFSLAHLSFVCRTIRITKKKKMNKKKSVGK